MKIYIGKRLGEKETLPEVSVLVYEYAEGIPLHKERKLIHRVYHSPTGFEWGYGGSGPADLARSILWDFLGEEPERSLYQSFKNQFVAGWGDEWEITSEEIKSWIIKTFGEVYYNYLGEVADPRD